MKWNFQIQISCANPILQIWKEISFEMNSEHFWIQFFMTISIFSMIFSFLLCIISLSSFHGFAQCVHLQMAVNWMEHLFSLTISSKSSWNGRRTKTETKEISSLGFVGLHVGWTCRILSFDDCGSFHSSIAWKICLGLKRQFRRNRKNFELKSNDSCCSCLFSPSKYANFRSFVHSMNCKETLPHEDKTCKRSNCSFVIDNTETFKKTLEIIGWKGDDATLFDAKVLLNFNIQCHLADETTSVKLHLTGFAARNVLRKMVRLLSIFFLETSQSKMNRRLTWIFQMQFESWKQNDIFSTVWTKNGLQSKHGIVNRFWNHRETNKGISNNAYEIGTYNFDASTWNEEIFLLFLNCQQTWYLRMKAYVFSLHFHVQIHFLPWFSRLRQRVSAKEKVSHDSFRPMFQKNVWKIGLKGIGQFEKGRCSQKQEGQKTNRKWYQNFSIFKKKITIFFEKSHE